jgi:hypothetical protein
VPIQPLSNAGITQPKLPAYLHQPYGTYLHKCKLDSQEKKEESTGAEVQIKILSGMVVALEPFQSLVAQGWGSRTERLALLPSERARLAVQVVITTFSLNSSPGQVYLVGQRDGMDREGLYQCRWHLSAAQISSGARPPSTLFPPVVLFLSDPPTLKVSLE